RGVRRVGPKGRGERGKPSPSLTLKTHSEREAEIRNSILLSLFLLHLHLLVSPPTGLSQGCQAPPEGPILCINNCGFFGSVATMNMCSKCYKQTTLNQDQAKLAASSIENIVNGSSSTTGKEPVLVGTVDVQVAPSEPIIIATPEVCSSGLGESSEAKPKLGPNRCTSCKKRVGLTGFNCRCGHLFCATHRYSDKHECPFDYRSVARDAIAKANPVVKAEKLNKI
ncbi:hypothetical protein V2J09_022665, partial [Rumex salicifolius]